MPPKKLEKNIDKKIELTISHPKIINFLNKYENVNIEELILSIVEMTENIISDSTTLSSSMSKQIFDSLNNQNMNLTNMLTLINTQTESYKNELTSFKEICKLSNENINKELETIKKLFDLNNEKITNKLNDTKDIYIKELKSYILNNEASTLLSISDKVDNSNRNLFNEFKLFIQESMPETQKIIYESLLKDFKHDMDILTTNFKNNKSDLTFNAFTEIMNSKTSELIKTIHDNINTSILNSEKNLNTNIETLKELSSDTRKNQENIGTELMNYLNRHNKSTTKGTQSEEMLKNVLNDIFASAEILSTSTQSKSGDFLLRRNNLPDILIENKNYTNSVPYDEVTKFHRDIEHNDYCNGLFISQSSIISGKQNFQLDFHNNAVLLYIHKCDYDPIKINTAIQIIDSISSKINLLKDNNISITNDMMLQLNQEFQAFIEMKNQNIINLKDFYNKQIKSLNELTLPSLERLLSLYFASGKKNTHMCEFCNTFATNNKMSMARHHRFCKEKIKKELDEKQKKLEQIKEIKKDKKDKKVVDV
jgi:soluble P-type ATPase